MRCRYSDIKEIYDWSERFADEKVKRIIGKQLTIWETAYFTPSQANWSYRVGLVKVGRDTYEVVEVFGEIRAARLVQLPHYDTKELKRK